MKEEYKTEQYHNKLFYSIYVFRFFRNLAFGNFSNCV